MKTRHRAALVQNGGVHFLLLVQEKVDRKRRTPERGMFRFIPLSGLSPFSDQREGCGPLFGNTPEPRSPEGRSKRGTAHGSSLCRFKDGGPGGRENEIPSSGRAFSFFHFLFARAKRKWSVFSHFAGMHTGRRPPIGLRPLPPRGGESKVGLLKTPAPAV